MTEAAIFVRFDVPGWHWWESAPKHRAYLASAHRHVFRVEVRMTVTHDDREVEFHDLIDKARSLLSKLAPQGAFGGQSCERIASVLGMALAAVYDRQVEVTVSEDGECGATVQTKRPATKKVADQIVALEEASGGSV